MSKSQNTLILNRLKRGWSINALQALEKFQCFRLAARISDLRDQGYNIITKMIETPNSKKRIAQYKLAR